MRAKYAANLKYSLAVHLEAMVILRARPKAAIERATSHGDLGNT